MLANKEFLVRTGIVLPAGTTSQAPLTLKQGTLLSSVNSGSLEWDGFNLFITENKSNSTSSTINGIARRTIAYTDSTMTAVTASYTAAGTTQAAATAIVAEVANVNSSSASTAPFNGVTLPPAISGRRVTVVNNSANPIYVYPLPVASSLTASSSGTVLTVSSTAGLYAGMPISSTGGTGGGGGASRDSDCNNILTSPTAS